MTDPTHQTALFAAGCFWGVEETFRQLPGVVATSVGYTDGELENPTYQDVCTGTSGHAEVVEVIFDPARISYQQLLAAFWRLHDPTTLNRQGPDRGTQYRSGIYFNSPEQEKAATESKAQEDASGRHNGPIVTEIAPASTYYLAEDYHQQYLAKRGLSNCH